jgi:cell division septation protein DedD
MEAAMAQKAPEAEPAPVEEIAKAEAPEPVVEAPAVTEAPEPVVEAPVVEEAPAAEPTPEESQAALGEVGEAAEVAEEAPQEEIDLEAEEEVREARLKRPSKLYVVQVGAFSSLENADDLAVELKKKGYPSYVQKSHFEKKNTLYLVLVGRYAKRQKADERLQQLKADKINAFIKVLKD